MPHGILTPKSTFAIIKIWQIFSKSIFYKINQRKFLANSLWAKAKLPNIKFGIFISAINSTATILD
jgi:hypothetical protein